MWCILNGVENKLEQRKRTGRKLEHIAVDEKVKMVETGAWARHDGRRRSLRADTVVGRHGRRGAAIEKVDVVSLNPIGAVETPEKLDPCVRVVGEGPKQPRRLPVSDLERPSNAGP